MRFCDCSPIRKAVPCFTARAQWRGEDWILRAFHYREDAGRLKALLCSGRQHMQPAISAGQNKTDDDL